MSLEIVKKEISLNVGQPNNFEIICAMQGDNKSFEITATLYDVNKLYTINTDNIKIKGVNPVGSNLYKDVDTHTANTVTFTLTGDMLAYDGLLKLVLVLTNSSTQLTTFPFVIKVVNSPGDTSTTDIVTVSALVEEAEKWALLSKSYAIGTEGEVREGDATDNSKYYYELSKESANDSKSYYEQLQNLIDSGEIGNGNANILYYETYEEFKTDFDAGNIETETLICIKENSSIDDTEDSDEAPELDTPFESGTMVALGYTSDSGYKSPTCYSTDNGKTWKQLNNSSFVLPFYTYYGNNNRIKLCNSNYYIFNNSTIYKSNTLKQWNVLCENSSFKESDCFFCDNKIMILGGYDNNSLYSIDEGHTWNQTDIPVSNAERELKVGTNSYIVSEYKLISFCSSNNNSMYVAGGYHGHCYYSYNGKNWNSITELYENNQYVAVYNNGKFYLIGFLMHHHDEVDDSKIRIYSSSDGISWSKIVETNTNNRYLFLSDKFYTCLGNKIIFGTTPELTIFDADTNSITYVTPNYAYIEFRGMIEFNNELYAIGTSSIGDLYKSSDAKNWENVTNYVENGNLDNDGILVVVP